MISHDTARHIARCILLLTTFALAGVSTLARAEASPATTGIAAGQILNLLGGLVIVLAVIAAFAWCAKRMAPAAHRNSAALRVVAAAAVGTRERVVIVEIGSTWLVVGVAPGSVSALHQMPRATDIPAMTANAAAPASFAAWFKHVLETRGAR